MDSAKLFHFPNGPARFRAIAIAIAAALVSASASAKVIHVDAGASGVAADGMSWAQAFTSIGVGLGAAEVGDELWVAGGVYPEAIVMQPGVALYGGFAGTEGVREARDIAANETVIDASSVDAPNHAVTGADVSVLDGVTVTGGQADFLDPFNPDDPDGYGGGVYAKAISMILANCRFANNLSAQNGGGIYGEGSVFTITDCAFVGNSTTGGGGGAGLAGLLSIVTLSRCRVESNHASGGGGGVLAIASTVGIAQSLILGNIGGLGGGLGTFAGSNVTVENTVLGGNSAGLAGGAIYNTASVSLRNCTLSGNSAGATGGGVETPSGGTFTAVNSIFWGNEAAEFNSGEDATVAVTRSIVAGGFPGEGNVDTDPRFRLVMEPYPFTLSWDSPAIDSAFGVTPDVDLAGSPRPQNAAPDRGAYEFGTDTDGGGLPDAYETEIGLLPSDETDDGANTDGDALDNLEEFRRGSSPFDPADPRWEFFVSTAGDNANDGTEQLPWRTIAFAMETVAPLATEGFPITIRLDRGEYNEPVVFVPHVRLVGAGDSLTTITYFDAADDEHVVVRAAEDTGLSDLTVTVTDNTPEGIALVEIDNVRMAIERVTLDGLNNTDSTALLISGAGSSGSSVKASTISKCQDGVHATDTEAIISGNLFDDIREDAVFVRLPEGKQTGLTPRLGDETNEDTPGQNQFQDVQGLFVNNISPALTKAELNDWGLYTEEEIDAKMAGQVDFEPFVKSSAPGSISGRVKHAITGARISGVRVTAYVRTDSRGEDVTAADGEYVISTLDQEVYEVEFVLTGYVTETREISVRAGAGAVANLALTPSGEGEGEGEGEGQGCDAAAGAENLGPESKADVAILIIAGLGLLALRRSGRRASP